MKDVCHIWELGGGSLFTSLLGNQRLLSNYGPLTVIVMLDLSQLDCLWLSLETLIDNLKNRLQSTSETFSWNELSDHPVSRTTV